MKGQIEVTDGAYRVLGDSEPAFVFAERELRRIPGGTIWGFFGYANPDLEQAALAILDEIQALGAEVRLLPAGQYAVELRGGYPDRFEADGSGAIQYGGTLGYYHMLPFALAFHGDRWALRDVVRRVGESQGDALHLRVFTWEGDVFVSWVLGRGL